MSDAIENEIYQELYAIRSSLQSVDLRYELSGIRQELQRANAQLEKICNLLEKTPGDSSSGGGEYKQKPDKRFRFI
ncbi:MAG: hypothetical protein FJY77_03970 [Candidatus Altiarchaeales archaeon]|nr:hypothetical protein [Candidatus Altiarchaeales archaeon]